MLLVLVRCTLTPFYTVPHSVNSGSALYMLINIGLPRCLHLKYYKPTLKGLISSLGFQHCRSASSRGDSKSLAGLSWSHYGVSLAAAQLDSVM